jgi:UMF1 family MFS transporter
MAAEGFSAMAVAVFFPIILKGLSGNAAVEKLDHSIPCNTEGRYYCDIQLWDGFYLDTSSIVLYATSISVLIQFILFTMLGSLADFGGKRLQFMLGFGIATAVVGFCIVFVVDNSLWWFAYLVYIVGNTFFGASWVFLYAWIPVLTKASPEVIAADADPLVNDEEFYAVSDRVGNEISAKSFFVGYIAAVLQLIIASAVVIGLGKKLNDKEIFGGYKLPSSYPMQLCIGAICVWQVAVILGYTRNRMRTRPGPDLPAGENYITFSLTNLYATIKQARKLSELFKFLVAWFIYSDSFSTLASVAILFAQSELGAQTPLLLLCSIIVPLAAGLGNLIWLRIQKKFNLPSKTILLIQAAFYSVLPLYGFMGKFVSVGTFFGLQNQYELPMISLFHGFLLGATQSTCRVIFSELLPHGHEAEFFGLYEVTDKGSSWLGPLMVGIIADATGSMRWSFVLLFAFFIIPLLIFKDIDISKGKQEARDFVKNEDRHHVKHIEL